MPSSESRTPGHCPCSASAVAVYWGPATSEARGYCLFFVTDPSSHSVPLSSVYLPFKRWQNYLPWLHTENSTGVTSLYFLCTALRGLVTPVEFSFSSKTSSSPPQTFPGGNAVTCAEKDPFWSGPLPALRRRHWTTPVNPLLLRSFPQSQPSLVGRGGRLSAFPSLNELHTLARYYTCHTLYLIPILSVTLLATHTHPARAISKSSPEPYWVTSPKHHRWHQLPTSCKTV